MRTTTQVVAAMLASAGCGSPSAVGDAAIEALPIDVPELDAPVFDAPIFDAPIFDAPIFDAPIFDAPIFDAPIDARPDARPDAAIDAAPDPGSMVDLALARAEMAASLRVTREAFSANSCAINECLAQPGVRRLLRFDTIVMNVGDAALVLGRPDPSTTSWEYDTCHQHYHYIDFANYELVDASGAVVAAGHKQSFCLRDDHRVTAGAPSNGYDCTNQGLSPGWADRYAADLDCQFVDITGVAPGTYRLRVEINTARTITESRYDNDVALFTIAIE